MFRDSTSCEFNCKLSLKGLNQSPSNLANYISALYALYSLQQNKQLVRRQQGDKNMLGHYYEGSNCS